MVSTRVVDRFLPCSYYRLFRAEFLPCNSKRANNRTPGANNKDTDGEKAVHDDSTEDWAVQYQEYCIEKERALDEAEKKKKKKLQKSEE